MSDKPTSTSDPAIATATPDTGAETETTVDPRYMAKPEDSYTKLAMKNMVRQRSTSLFHFAVTLFAVLGFLVGISVLFH